MSANDAQASGSGGVETPVLIDLIALGRWQRVTSVLLLVVVLIAGTTLVGWNCPELAARLPAIWDVMKANTAAGMLLSAVSFWLFGKEAHSWRRGLSRILGWLVLSMAVLTLLEFLSGHSFGMDNMLVHPALRNLSAPMAEPTATAFVLLGIALQWAGARDRYIAIACDLVILVTGGWVALTAAGYLFGAPILYEAGGNTHSAPQTLVCFALLTAAIVMRQARSGLFAVFASTGAGGRAARLLLPLVAVLPFFFTWTGVWTREHAWLTEPYANALTVALHSAVLFFLLHWLARRMNREEAALRASEEQYRDLFDNTVELIHSVRPDGTFEYVNAAWKKRLGYSDEEVAGLKIQDILAPESRTADRAAFEAAFRGEDVGRIQRVLLAKDGTRIHVEGVLGVRRDVDGRVVAARILYHDITEQKQAEEAARAAKRALERALERETAFARRDGLTGLHNRRAFFELGTRELARLRRQGQPASLAYVDLDNFKQLNDQEGHEAGDLLLSQVGAVLKQHLRKTDLAARLGGDEFVALLPDTPAEPAMALLQKIVELLKQEMRRKNWPVTFSIGLATWAVPSPDPELLIRQADALMYAAKKSGKNRIESAIYPPA